MIAAIVIAGAMVLSPAIAMLDFPALPGDIVFDRPNLHLTIPVIYSLAASIDLALLFWWLRK